jgi:cysteine desulfurase
MQPRAYFDNSATTPLDPRVRDAMGPYAVNTFGNPSSLHHEGRLARAAVDKARAQIARLINADASEIVITGSGTESDNLALVGVLNASDRPTRHVVVSAIEHPAILASCDFLTRNGIEVTRVNPDADGIVQPRSIVSALRPDTVLVSVMAANNVVGTLQPIDEIGRIAHAHGALFHTDAVQAAGKIPVDVRSQAIDLLSLSAHKLHGPKGVGALFVRKGVEPAPIVHGGGQERGLRSATENVPGIVGFGEATAIAASEMALDAARLVGLREELINALLTRIPTAYLIGHRFRRLPGHVCVGFAGYEGEAIALLLKLDEAGFAVSTGSACSAHKAAEPSYILTALGFDPLRARGSLRITLGRFNTSAEVERLSELLPRLVATLKPIGHQTPLKGAPTHVDSRFS